MDVAAAGAGCNLVSLASTPNQIQKPGWVQGNRTPLWITTGRRFWHSAFLSDSLQRRRMKLADCSLEPRPNEAGSYDCGSRHVRSASYSACRAAAACATPSRCEAGNRAERIVRVDFGPRDPWRPNSLERRLPRWLAREPSSSRRIQRKRCSSERDFPAAAPADADRYAEGHDTRSAATEVAAYVHLFRRN